jgi:hypothetical protein
MKYYKFKLDWTNPNEGTDPTHIINKEYKGFTINFIANNNPDAFYYSYLQSGELDISKYSNWNLEIVEKDDFYNAAKLVHSNAFWSDNIIKWPMSDILSKAEAPVL